MSINASIHSAAIHSLMKGKLIQQEKKKEVLPLLTGFASFPLSNIFHNHLEWVNATIVLNPKEFQFNVHFLLFFLPFFALLRENFSCNSTKKKFLQHEEIFLILLQHISLLLPCYVSEWSNFVISGSSHPSTSQLLCVINSKKIAQFLCFLISDFFLQKSASG